MLEWPDGRKFAFTIYDDTDETSVATVKPVYDVLYANGLLTTKTVWPLAPIRSNIYIGGQTCAEPDYRDWVLQLQAQGYEIAFHNVTPHSSERSRTIEGLNEFRNIFGQDPRSQACHADCEDCLYAGEGRLSGVRRVLYNILTRRRSANYFRGHDDSSPFFWGDIAKKRIRYDRNFVFSKLNTLEACPVMPYHDPNRPYVNYWFCGSDAGTYDKFLSLVTPDNLEALRDQRGVCILYVHFGYYFRNGRVTREFVRLIERIASMDAWLAPTSAILDFIHDCKGHHEITSQQRADLEWRWLWDKVRHGGS